MDLRDRWHYENSKQSSKEVLAAHSRSAKVH